jgi:hypothetical protein
MEAIMNKKQKKPNFFKKIINSLYYDHSGTIDESGKAKRTKRLPVDKEVDRIKANTPPTY